MEKVTHYTIVRNERGQGLRLIAPEGVLLKIDFKRIISDLQRQKILSIRAHKVVQVSARQATKAEHFERHFKGKHMHNETQPGDWIVTSMDSRGSIIFDSNNNTDTYVVKREDFSELYTRASGSTAFGDIYDNKSTVDAIYFPGGYDVVAPWGEKQQEPKGYLVLNGDDVYGIAEHIFSDTYKKVSSQ